MTHHAANLESLPQRLAQVASLANKTRLSLPFVIDIPLTDMGVIDWLAVQPTKPKFYWCGRSREMEIGGVGVGYKPTLNNLSSIVNIEKILTLLHDKNLFFVGGRCFDPMRKRDELWKSFPQEIFYIPQHAIIKQDGKCRYCYCVTINPGDCPEEKIKLINEEINKPEIGFRSKPVSKTFPPPTKTEFNPDRDKWQSQVLKILQAIDSDNIEKLVLARRTDYHFDEMTDPFELLLQLKIKHQHGFRVLYQVESGETFISVTPERLYRRDGRQLQIDALSSTTARGQTEAEDREREREFIHDNKELREHDYVIRGILRSIEPLCSQKPTAGKTSLLKLERIQHMRTELTARLKSSVGDSDVIESLHPTPAVGGVPTLPGLAMIRQMESFDRGWYAAPVGFVSFARAEFAVAIRSLLMRDKVVSVFTGAGIVRGSDAEKEWRELESKDILCPFFPGVIT